MTSRICKLLLNPWANCRWIHDNVMLMMEIAGSCDSHVTHHDDDNDDKKQYSEHTAHYGPYHHWEIIWRNRGSECEGGI